MNTEMKPARPMRPRRLLAGLGMIALGLLLAWRATSLGGLPDVGDPFDVAAFAAVSVADEANAFVLYRQAVARLVKTPPGAPEDWQSSGDPEAERTWGPRWLAANREALDLWRRGTERPEAEYVPPRSMNFATMLPVIQWLRALARLAVREGERLEAEGDPAGALGWYLAVARSGNHCGRRGLTIERLVGIGLKSLAFNRLTRWAAHPKVDAALLRRAIAEVEAGASQVPPDSDCLKAEYLSFRNSIDDPKLMDPKWLGGDLPKIYEMPGGRAIMEDLPRVYKREPERSRRVIRLIIANWLAFCDLPDDRRPPHVANPLKKWGNLHVQVDLPAELFAADASAPASARVLPPEELARWWDSTLYAKRYLPSLRTLDKTRAREKTERAALLIALGNELYQRDHGWFPDRAEELVGPYLKALPETFVPPAR